MMSYGSVFVCREKGVKCASLRNKGTPFCTYFCYNGKLPVSWGGGGGEGGWSAVFGPVFFSRELFLEQFTAGSPYRQMYGKFKTRMDAFWHSYIPPIFFLIILFLVPNVSNS